MVLSISRKVDVKPGVIKPVLLSNIQNCLLLSDKDKFYNHEILEFLSADEVSETFGINSKEHNFAISYFNSYVGATKKPEKLLIGENYSLEARPASVTSTFFTITETPAEEISKIGQDNSIPSIVMSPILSYFNITDISQNLRYIGTNIAISSIIQSKIFFPKEPLYDPSIDSIYQLLNEIGADESNYGDFSITFNVDDEEITATASNINLSNTLNIEEALKIINEAVNIAIIENTDLGEDYKVTISLNGNDDTGFYFLIKTINKGAKYNIANVFSTTPVISNIADILCLSDFYKPQKQPGADRQYGDFSITFNVDDEEITATASELDFTNLNVNLEDQLNYLESQINEVIGSHEDLGTDYCIDIVIENIEDNNFILKLKTKNTGESYNITNIFSTKIYPKVADICFLTKNSNASYFPGADRQYGDFSITFNVDDEEITATASELDFTNLNVNLEDQLNYLENQINEAIGSHEDLGTDYLVNITKNNLANNLYNISVKTSSNGYKYDIKSISSTLPEGFLTVADILKLSPTTIPVPVIIRGSDNLSISEVLDKYTNDRNDWWTIATTIQNYDTYMQISIWVDQKNNGVRYVFIAHDNNELAKTTYANNNTYGYSVYNNGYKGTTIVFGNETMAGFVAGIAASIDYERKNGTITFSGRRQDNLEVTVNTDREADFLESNYYNYYGSYSSTNNKYKFFETGIVSGRDGQNWLDSLFNQIYLLIQLQTAIFNLLLDKKKIPFSNSGYAMIFNACDAVAMKAVNIGIITPGVTLDEQQIETVNEMVGKNVSTNLYQFGYYLYIGNNTPADRQKRIAKNCILFYCDGGSIQTVEFVANVLL